MANLPRRDETSLLRPPLSACEDVNSRGLRPLFQCAQDLVAGQEEDILWLRDDPVVRKPIADPQHRSTHDRPCDGQFADLFLTNRYHVLRIGQEPAEGAQATWGRAQDLERRLLSPMSGLLNASMVPGCR